jgi:hypothetical protein
MSMGFNLIIDAFQGVHSVLTAAQVTRQMCVVNDQLEGTSVALLPA